MAVTRLSNYLSENISRDPDRALIIFDGEKITNSEFKRIVARFVHHLRENGIGAGDRFAYCGENHPIVLAAVFAASQMDATFVPIAGVNHLAAPTHIENLGVKFSIADTEAKALWHRLRFEGMPSDISSVELMRHPRIIFLTSGTSGTAKYVALPESHLSANIEASIETQRMGRDDVVLATLSICHSGGLCIQTLPAICAGAILILSTGFSVASFRELAVAHSPTVTLTVPSHLRLMKLSSLWDESILEKFRLIGIGSALLSASLARVSQFKRLKLMNIYGLTEAGPCAVTGWLEKHSVTSDDAVSIGLPGSGIEIKLSSGESGEIQLRGAAVDANYIDETGVRPACDSDGWFATGDVGFRKGSDFFLVGRNSEFLNVGGMKMHPGEIENVIADIEGVRACAVVTRTHSVFGEILVGYVELETGTSMKRIEIVRRCKEKLARYKVPREIEFVSALPRSAIGKILKSKLTSGAA